MLQLYPVYLLCNRRKTLTGSPDPTRANGTNKPCTIVFQFKDRPYPMTQLNLGHVVIINNLRSKVKDTAGDVLALKAALETVGFNVKCYDDCNKQVHWLVFNFSTFCKIF